MKKIKIIIRCTILLLMILGCSRTQDTSENKPELNITSKEIELYLFIDVESRSWRSSLEKLVLILDSPPGNISTDDIFISVRHFPLSYHKNAFLGALAVECANEQQQGLVYIAQLRFNAYQMDEHFLKSVIEEGEMKMDQAQFNECIDSRKYEQAVLNDIAWAKSLGIRGSPSVLIDDEIISGFDVEEIQAVLAKAVQRRKDAGYLS